MRVSDLPRGLRPVGRVAASRLSEHIVRRWRGFGLGRGRPIDLRPESKAYALVSQGHVLYKTSDHQRQRQKKNNATKKLIVESKQIIKKTFGKHLVINLKL